jgi:hypothetical protein
MPLPWNFLLFWLLQHAFDTGLARVSDLGSTCKFLKMHDWLIESTSLHRQSTAHERLTTTNCREVTFGMDPSELLLHFLLWTFCVMFIERKYVVALKSLTHCVKIKHFWNCLGSNSKDSGHLFYHLHYLHTYCCLHRPFRSIITRGTSKRMHDQHKYSASVVGNASEPIVANPKGEFEKMTAWRSRILECI